MDKLIDYLMNIGFSKYESQAYLALLRQSPVTGYELSKQSGVPRSMIYQTINKLISQGAINEIHSDPLTYTPIPPKEFLRRLREKNDETFNYLDEKLQILEQPPIAYVIRHIDERLPVIDTMNALILKAKHEICLSLWDSELDNIRPHAKKTLDSGVKLYSLLFNCEPTSDFGKTFYHRASTAFIEEQRMGQRLTIVICDNKEVVIAGFSDGTIPFAIRTEDPLLILLAKEYIRHDISLKAISEKWGVENMKKFLEEDPDLLYVITNQLSDRK
jgi:HTH-type transcriptional regulator, sugar sensing transcriptional regulator